MRDESDDKLFVGYAPLPARLRRNMLAVAFAIALCGVILAALFSSAQRDPGDGQWSEDASTITGVYSSMPYPMIRMGRATSILLVGQGKFGPVRPSEPLELQTVRATGRPITRGSLRLLELDRPLERLGPADAVKPFDSAPAVDRSFVGEIVDPKCFAGSMKPGDGKTHKSCAALCLRGGIPPVLRVGDHCYLLSGPNQTPCDGGTLERVISLVGESGVVVSGKLQVFPGLPVLEISAYSVTRP